MGGRRLDRTPLGSQVTPPDCDKNKTLCDQEMMGLLPGKTRNPTLTEKQPLLTGLYGDWGLQHPHTITERVK